MTAPPGTAAFPIAGLERRLQAFLIDRALVWSIYLVTVAVGWRLGFGWSGVLLVAATVLLLPTGYAAALGIAGVSPGRMARGLRVAHHATGGPIGFGPALLRTALLGVATIPTLGIGLVLLAWSALTEEGGRRRGLHDRVAGSLVLDVRPVEEEVEVEPAAPPHLVNLTTMRLTPAAEPSSTSPPPRTTAPSRPSTRWRLSFDTGEHLVVEGLVLIGRLPVPRAGERAHHLVALSSADLTLSRTHARVRPAPDGALVITDAGSVNGSTLLRQGAVRALPAARPATLRDGDRVRLGDREMLVSGR